MTQALLFERIELRDFRLYARLAVDFAPGVNVLTGPNAAGKTTVLEALGLLATGRSFRGAADSEMVRSGQLGYSVAGRYTGRAGSHSVEVSYLGIRSPAAEVAGSPGSSRKSVSLDGKALTRSAELLGRVPVLSFSPDDLVLAKGGPAERRHYLDVVLGQTSPSYREHLTRYQKTLAQRNALLGDLAARRVRGDDAQIMLEPWDEALAAEAEAVQSARAGLVERLSAPAATAFAGIDGRTLDLVYQPARFDPTRRRDELRRGLTLTGAHRDEVVLTVDGRDARRYASQGQQRSVVLSLKLAALDYLEGAAGEKPVLLLDDVMSELDPRRRAALLPLLFRGQAFVTGTDRKALAGIVAERDLEDLVGRWFEVTGDGRVLGSEHAAEEALPATDGGGTGEDREEP